MSDLLALALCALGALALAIAVLCLRHVASRPERERCPSCGHPKARAEIEVCVECGAGLDARSLRRRRVRWLWRGAAMLVVALALLFGAAVARYGIAAIPTAALVEFANPFDEPATLRREAYDELIRRIGRGEVAPSALTRLLALGLDRAFARPDVFVLRTSWPVDEPLRLTLRRDALNHVRGPNDVRLVFIGPDGEFRRVSQWGNPDGPGEGSVEPGAVGGAWSERTIEIPKSCDIESGVAFDVAAVDTKGGTLWRRRVEVPVSREGLAASALETVASPALWEELRDRVQIRVAPIPRQGHPQGALAVWFKAPLPSLPRDLAVGLRITIESLDVPGLRCEGRVLVRAAGNASSPSSLFPLCLDHPDQPRHWGRCRIRLEADPAMALRDLTKAKRLDGSVEFELALEDAPSPASPREQAPEAP